MNELPRKLKDTYYCAMCLESNLWLLQSFQCFLRHQIQGLFKHFQGLIFKNRQSNTKLHYYNKFS